MRVSCYYQYDNEFAEYRRSMEVKHINAFERQQRISVNVYMIENNKVRPRQITELNPENVHNHVDLLLLDGGHYVLIRDLSRLCRKQVTGNKIKHHICKRCLHICTSERVLKNHVERCAMHKAQAVKMPTPTVKNPGNTVHFTAIENQLPLPFWFVADFKAISEPCNAEVVLPKVPVPDCPVLDPKTGKMRFSEHLESTEKGSHAGSSTVKTSKQIACGVAYQFCSFDPRFYAPPVVFHGRDCAEKILDSILEDAQRVRTWLAVPEPQPVLTSEEQR